MLGLPLVEDEGEPELEELEELDDFELLDELEELGDPGELGGWDALGDGMLGELGGGGALCEAQPTSRASVPAPSR